VAHLEGKLKTVHKVKLGNAAIHITEHIMSDQITAAGRGEGGNREGH